MFQQELLHCLHEAEAEIRNQRSEMETERLMYATNPHFWQEVYGSSEGEGGVVISEPTTKEEFEALMDELGMGPL